MTVEFHVFNQMAHPFSHLLDQMWCISWNRESKIDFVLGVYLWQAQSGPYKQVCVLIPRACADGQVTWHRRIKVAHQLALKQGGYLELSRQAQCSYKGPQRQRSKRKKDGSVRQTWPSIAGSTCGGRALCAKESGQNLETEKGKENQSLLVPPEKNAPT